MSHDYPHECECDGCEECKAPLCRTCTEELLTSQARTIRRLRALAAGYRARALRNGQAAASNCETCNEQGAKDERARIVAWLRAEAEREGWSGTEAHAMQAAADIIESEEP